MRITSSLQPLVAIFVASFACGLCAVPRDLSNFQNEYVCDTKVRLVRPLTIADVQAAVKHHAHVVPVGSGESFDRGFFCAKPLVDDDGEDEEDGSDSTANIVMATIRPLEINIDEAEMAVWVSAGVPVWDLMLYLGNYVTTSAPRGYALASTPNFVNLTVAGAIITNSHGSSLTHGSITNQVIGMKVVLANGTLAEIDPDRHPFYFKAFLVSVGRLGIVTDVKLRIVRETLVKRTLHLNVTQQELLPKLKAAQEMYKKTGSIPDWLKQDVFLAWFSTDFTFGVYSLEEVEDDNSNLPGDSHDILAAIEAKINAPINLPRSEENGKVENGVQWTVPDPLPPDFSYSDPANVPQMMTEAVQGLITFMGNATLETHEAALTLPLAASTREQSVLHDDYEVAVPIDKMADCMEGFLNLVENLGPDKGFRNFLPLRFSGKEEGLLSVSNDKPILWFGVQDFVYYNREPRATNVPHKQIMAYLVTSELCSPGRLHWGKAGWPDPGCYNGADFYKDTWCDFGCAVRALDPDNKFIGIVPDRWNWNGANLETCCTAEGYDTSLDGCGCNVIPVRSPEDCPEAPFYTTR